MAFSALTAVVAVTGATTAAPLLADRLRRWLTIPTVVLEILLGIVLGPVLGWVTDDGPAGFVADFGLSMLMFLAGYESQVSRIRGGPLRGAVTGWLASLALAFGLSVIFWGFTLTTLVVGLALTTTALGTILPPVRDAGALSGAFGDRVLAIGTIGEFGPIVAVALVLSGQSAWHVAPLLAGFAAVAALAALAATRPRSPRLARLVSGTLGTSVQFAVRLALLMVVTMVWVADELGLDVLLGAFAAGIVFRLFLDTGDPDEAKVVEAKLDAIGFGFVVPFFFVVTGVRFELDALVSDPVALLLVPACLLLFLVVRGGPVLILERGFPLWPARSALALLAATGLPLVVVITAIGVERGALAPSTAAAMVAAGMLSVLILPVIGLRLLRSADTGEDAHPDAHPDVHSETNGLA